MSPEELEARIAAIRMKYELLGRKPAAYQGVLWETVVRGLHYACPECKVPPGEICNYKRFHDSHYGYRGEQKLMTVPSL